MFLQGCCGASVILAQKQLMAVLQTDRCCSIYQNGNSYSFFVNSRDVVSRLDYLNRSCRLQHQLVIFDKSFPTRKKCC